MYGRYEFSIAMIISHLRSKDLEIKATKISTVNDVFYVKGRYGRKEKVSWNSSRGKSMCRTRKLDWYY